MKTWKCLINHIINEACRSFVVLFCLVIDGWSVLFLQCQVADFAVIGSLDLQKLNLTNTTLIIERQWFSIIHKNRKCGHLMLVHRHYKQCYSIFFSVIMHCPGLTVPMSQHYQILFKRSNQEEWVGRSMQYVRGRGYNLQELGWEGTDWFDLSQDRDRWWVHVCVM
jgi:hypothetical protein